VLVETVALDPLDAAMLEFDALLRAPERARALRERFVRAAFRRHVAENAGYARYVTQLGVEPDDPDLALSAIPLLPSGLFKQPDLDLASVAPAALVKRCLSSGTSGSHSVVPRDEPTLSRFLGSITASLPALFGLDRTGRHRGIVLGPTTTEAGDLWFSYAIACLGLVVPTEYFETGGTFSAAAAANRVADTLADGLDVALIGPPARVLEVARAAAGGPPLSPGSLVVTAGGWKSAQARALDPVTFRASVARDLGVADDHRIRDSYNMVELNSVIHECEAHAKHMPPWVQAQSRDPATNALLAPGELGILAFLDPTATSFPCFILSEDFGIVRDGPCACGRDGQRVEIVRRMNRVESRGCALKLAVGHQSAERPGSTRFFAGEYRAPAR
jgi:long-chain-fatty-acid---luciferin-component ligase